MEDVLALVQEQMADLAALQKKQFALTAVGTAADRTVEVTVDARGVETKTVIDASYLDEFEFSELGTHVTAAAQAAAAEVGRRTAELIAPLNERRHMLPSLSDIVEGAPDIGALVDEMVTNMGPAPAEPLQDDDGWGEPPAGFPKVKG